MAEQTTTYADGLVFAIVLVVLIALVGMTAGWRLKGHDAEIRDLQRRIAVLEQK